MTPWLWFWRWSITSERIQRSRKRHAAEKEQCYDCNYHLPHAMLLEFFFSQFIVALSEGIRPFPTNFLN